MIRVLLIDDHPVVRQGLRTFLDLQPDITVVGEAPDGASGVAAADELRAIVVGQRPVDLTGDELDVALRKQVDLLDRVHEPAVRFVGACVPRLSDERQQAVFRIAQEALHNALRHADAANIDVDLVHRNGFVELEVRDDGRGFDPVAAGETSRKLGLSSMRERARTVGGRLTMTSKPGEGTSVRLAVPAG